MDVFVYGTLTDPSRARAVLDERFEFRGPARLVGLHRVDGRHPTLVPGGSVEGRLLRTDHLDSLDAYERVDSRLYVRMAVPTEDDESVQVYVGDPSHPGVESLEWPGSGSLTERVERYVEYENVVVRRTGTNQ